jgi:omega-6 fatty acid desaturase (delta-12 desaturase)
MPADDAPSAAKAADDLRRRLRPYHAPDPRRSAFEIAVSVAAFAGAWALMAVALHAGHVWLHAALVPLAALLLVRLFMIQHDCGHGSFFARREWNDWVGRTIGVLTLTPYDHWRRSHAIHHATSGNLDHRGVGDIDTLTVEEYRARSRWGRVRYRLYRHPVVMFGFGPSYVFLLQGRLPVGFMRKGLAPWSSTMATNAAILAVSALMIWAVGLVPFLLIQLPVVALGASIGVWLFFVQHQFERTHWREGAEWNALEAALHGSSHYDLPPALRWLTANIGVHHVHHLCAKIPYYRLPQVLRDFPELRDVGRLTIRQSLKCVPLALWDERSRRLISFAEFRAAEAAA